MKPTAPFPCTTCASLTQKLGGKNPVLICGKTGINAHTERANPNGCGPEGEWWSKR